jgi:hypothetical protein
MVFLSATKIRGDDLPVTTSNAPYFWFHTVCAEIEEIPNGNWYHSECRKIIFKFKYKNENNVNHIITIIITITVMYTYNESAHVIETEVTTVVECTTNTCNFVSAKAISSSHEHACLVAYFPLFALKLQLLVQHLHLT